MLSLPTAAFLEDHVLDYIERRCRALSHVALRRDRWGNLLAHFRRGAARRSPLVFTAHTDHPGFASLRMKNRTTLSAAFRGWVEPEYFVGTPVQFWSGGRWVKGRVEKIERVAPVYGLIGRTGRPEEVAVRVDAPVEPGCPGMWGLPDPYERDGCVHARGCDDVAGAAGLLAMLERLERGRSRTEAYALFTRAEEVGFIGAIGAARAGTIPRGLPIVAIETSKALANAVIGDGPILRVGDKTSIFTPAVTDYCDRVAKRMWQATQPAGAAGSSTKPAARRRAAPAPAGGFVYQRKLMDGGTCESTAYAAYGYPVTGICLALGNYHNMDVQRKRIDTEYVSLRDWERMVEWFVELAADRGGYTASSASLKKGMEERFARYRALLGANRPKGRTKRSK